MPVLRQMPNRAAFLRPERRRDAIHVLQRINQNLKVQLAALRQVQVLVEVLQAEKRGATLASGRNEHGRRILRKPFRGKVFARIR